MPFVEKSHRDKPDKSIAGDRCYIHYRRMMNMWKLNPCWTTFDEMTKSLYPNDEQRALFLATLVFFKWHVESYERQKEAENGEIK